MSPTTTLDPSTATWPRIDDYRLDRRAGQVGGTVDDDDRVRVTRDVSGPVRDEHEVGLLPGRQGDIALRGDEDPAGVGHLLGRKGERREQEEPDDQAEQCSHGTVDDLGGAGSHENLQSLGISTGMPVRADRRPRARHR